MMKCAKTKVIPEKQKEGKQNFRKRYFSAVTIAAVLLAFLIVQPALCATEEITAVRYDSDGNIAEENTYNYQWLEENLPVQGDGTTHYYMQGPTFDENDMWNPAEDINVLSRDMGAVKGTDIKDICETIGGMTPGGTIKIISEDGFSKELDYKNIYSPDPRQGPVCVCWYCGEESSPESKEQGSGYPPDYYTSMRIVFFADDSINPWGYHVFGNEDMKQTISEDNLHYFNGEWPSSGGLSVKYVDRIEIYEPEKTSDVGEEENTGSDEETKTPLSVFCIIGALAACFALRRF